MTNRIIASYVCLAISLTLAIIEYLLYPPDNNNYGCSTYYMQQPDYSIVLAIGGLFFVSVAMYEIVMYIKENQVHEDKLKGE